MKCSFCSMPLDKLNIGTQEQIYIWNCRECHSTFFPTDTFKITLRTITHHFKKINHDVYRLILSTPKQIDENTTPSQPTCPLCLKLMQKDSYSNTNIVIHTCKKHGIWVENKILNQIHKYLISFKEKSSTHTDNQSTNIKNHKQEHMGFLTYLFWMIILFIPLLWGIDIIEYTSNLYKNIHNSSGDSSGTLYLSGYILMLPFILLVINFLNKLFGIFALFAKIKREITTNISPEIIIFLLKIIMAIIGIVFLNLCFDDHDDKEREDYIELFVLGVFLILPLLEILLNILFARIYESIKK